MVYVINSEACFDSSFDLAKLRNQLFTAITRSKAWVRVLGIGSGMDGLISEYEQVKKHDFKLEFTYPTKSQRDHMNIVNRDMSESEKNRIRNEKNNVAGLIDGLQNGQIYVEDLGEEQVEKLLSLLDKKRK